MHTVMVLMCKVVHKVHFTFLLPSVFLTNLKLSFFQISEGKSGEKGGVVNKGFDTEGKAGQEKDEKKEKWMENYVPYGKYPAGSPMDDVTFTSEKEVNVNKEVDNKDVTDGKDGEEGAKWKDNYVPYEEAENKAKEEEE